MNTAVRIRTPSANPRPALRAIEARLGRVRTADRFAPRPIDLDLLAVDGEILDEDVLDRPWLLGALIELAPSIAPPPRDESADAAALAPLLSRLDAELGPDRIVIFGAGLWFLGEPCPTSDIDIVAVVRQPAVAREGALRAEVARAATGARPVHLRLFGEADLKAGGTRSSLLHTEAHARLYLRQMRHWRVLAGAWDPAAWPPPLPPDEEMGMLAPALTAPPDTAFLAASAPAPDERFDWPHFVRLSLFWQALADHAEGYAYQPSVHGLAKRRVDDPGHPIHRALAYRQYGHSVRPSRRRAFHRALSGAVAAWREARA